MDKKAEHATEVALTALDKLASLVETKAGTGGMSPKLAKAIVRELDKVVDQLELTMFGEDSLLYRQASILSKTDDLDGPELAHLERDWVKIGEPGEAIGLVRIQPVYVRSKVLLSLAVLHKGVPR